LVVDVPPPDIAVVAAKGEMDPFIVSGVAASK
jgi:hypothetical protein